LALALASIGAVKDAQEEDTTCNAGPWVIYGGFTNVIVIC